MSTPIEVIESNDPVAVPWRVALVRPDGRPAVRETDEKYVMTFPHLIVREIILRSADWFDAAPAPFGADAPAVPVEARILATCEEFVTLTAGADERPAAGRALAAIQKRRGRKHDPEVVAALVRALERETAAGGGRA